MYFNMGVKGAAVATVTTQFLSNIFVCLLVKDLRRNIVLAIQALNPVVVLRFVNRKGRLPIL